MSTPEQPASDANNAAHCISNLRSDLAYAIEAEGLLVTTVCADDLRTALSQLAAQQAALSAAKDALEEVAKAVLQYQKVCPADPDTTRQFLLAGADLDCAMSVTTTALAQIRALGNNAKTP